MIFHSSHYIVCPFIWRNTASKELEMFVRMLVAGSGLAIMMNYFRTLLPPTNLPHFASYPPYNLSECWVYNR